MRASNTGIYISVMAAADDSKLTEWSFDDDELDEHGAPRRRRIIPWVYGQHIYFELEDFHRPCICDYVVISWDGREVCADTIAPRPRDNGFVDAHYKYLANRVELRFGDFGHGAQRFRLPDRPRDDVASGGEIKIEVWSRLRVAIEAPPTKARRTANRSQTVRDVVHKGILRATVSFQYRTEEWRAQHGCVLDSERAAPKPAPKPYARAPPSNPRAPPSNTHTPSSSVRHPPKPKAPAPDVRPPAPPIPHHTPDVQPNHSSQQLLPSPPSSHMGHRGTSSTSEAQLSRRAEALRDQSATSDETEVHLAYPSIKLEVDELEEKFSSEEAFGMDHTRQGMDEQDLTDELEVLVLQKKRKDNSINNQLAEIKYQTDLKHSTYDLRIKLCQMRRAFIQDQMDENVIRHRLASFTAPPDAHRQRAFEQGQAQLTDEALEQEVEERKLGIEKRRASLKRPVEVIELD